MTGDDNKVLMRRLMDVLLQGDLDELEEHPGLHEVRERIPWLREAFPDIHARVENQIAEGGWVSTHAWFEGTHAGEFLGLAPTGKRVRFQHLTLDLIQDGKVVQHNAESGWLSLFMALEAVPFK